MSKNVFVFVVCGGEEHIETLHFSLQYLKFHSQNEIWVLTDSSRNEIPIVHDKMINVKTPSELNHHQASIYLKTGIHKFLPKGNVYCYLDTDIIACSEEINSVFDNYIAPITFAPDHCTMEQFSSYAVNCNCQKEYDEAREKLNQALLKVDPLRESKDEQVKKYRNQLIGFYENNRSLSSRIKLGIRFLLSRKIFHLNNELAYNRKRKIWFQKQSNVDFMHKVQLNKMSKNVGLKWNVIGNYPMLKDGRNIWKNDCFHLHKAIKDKFNIDVKNHLFQHWNGGVFLFDDQSHDFLNTWFNSTMEIFKDPYWKTRDQGTLIKTVWQFGLENHPTLHKKWNVIADYYNPHLKWVDDKTVQLNQYDILEPAFLHVYHHFGDENWDFWSQITNCNENEN